jgi:hypothetical protein
VITKPRSIFAKVVTALCDCIEVLPRDRERHHFRLTATSRHFDRVAGEVVVAENMEPDGRREAFEKVAVPAHLRDFVKPYKRFNCLTLRRVVPEWLIIPQPVFGSKPIVQKQLTCSCRAIITSFAPAFDQEPV